MAQRKVVQGKLSLSGDASVGMLELNLHVERRAMRDVQVTRERVAHGLDEVLGASAGQEAQMTV